MNRFAEPNVNDLVDAITEAIIISRKIIPNEIHERIKSMYSWFNVAKRTEIVYDNIMINLKSSLSVRLMKYYTAGSWSGVIICFIVIILYIYNYILDITYPRKDIEVSIELPWLQEQAKISGLDVNNKE